MMNEVYQNGIYNVTKEWKETHFHVEEICHGKPVCPLYEQHCCYPTCMYFRVTVDDEEGCYCGFAKKDSHLFNKED